MLSMCDKMMLKKYNRRFSLKRQKNVLEPNVIDGITEVVVNKSNSKIFNNAVLIKLQEELKEKNRE